MGSKATRYDLMNGVVSVICLLGATYSVHGVAQPSRPQQARVLEEIMVVAQRREEDAQLTPISIATFNSEALETLGITSLSDIGSQVPNFNIDTFPASNQTLRLFIRGVGITDVQITQDPAVGVYLDGVYLARSSGLAADVADLERIEVLRGPQGTLYGRNTTGGALNLVTKRPNSEAVEFSQVLGTGNRNRQYSKTSLNLPIGQDHAVKFAALSEGLDGFIDNDGPGKDWGDRKAEAYRFDWRWDISETVTLDYSWDKSRIESVNYTPQAQVPGVETGSPADPAVRSSRRFVDYRIDRVSNLDTTVPLLPTDTDIEGHGLNIEWQLPDIGITLKSISAYREMSDYSYVDFASGASEEYRVDFQDITIGELTPSPINFPSTRVELDHEQFSQEFQAIGEVGSFFEYTVGLYYFEEKAREDSLPLHHIFSFPLLELDDIANSVNVRGEDIGIDNKALAIFGQFTYTPDITDERLHFSIGWRRSEDERSVDRLFLQDSYLDLGTAVIGPIQRINFSADASNDFSDDSFSAMVEFDWTEDFHAYGKYVEAYKSGGYNIRDPDPVYFSEGFEEEKNRTIEFGFKGELLNSALRVNGNIFYSEFEDLQLNFLIPDTISDTRVFNSGAANIHGFETQIISVPWYGLFLRLDYAYLENDVDDVIDPFTGMPRSFALSNAPRHSGTLNIDYILPPMSFGEIAINVNYNYVGERDGKNGILFRDEFDLLNGRVALSKIPMLKGEVTVSAWIKNALDEEYVSYAIDNLPHSNRGVLWGESRSYGIDLKYEF